MADNMNKLSQHTLLRTGTGRLIGMVLSASSGTVTFTFYDNTAGSVERKYLEIHVPNAMSV